MTALRFDLLAIGNALVDVLSHTTDEFIASQEKHGMKRGAMALIDEARATELYGLMESGIETSGGSAGNTMAGFASFGGKGAYIGKVADDQLGAIYRHDMKAQGVEYSTVPLLYGASTGRCLILVTPDGHRTMNTFLGASVQLGPADIDADMVAAASMIYLEGYLFDHAQAKEAFKLASRTARDAGRRVALSLSDPFCVERHRQDFQKLIEDHVDILFANEDEIKSMYQDKDFDTAVKRIRDKCDIAVLTRSEKGSVIVSGDRTVEVKAEATRVVDTTGAGDQYAAGFLYGLSQDMDLGACGRLGALAAAEVISHMGPRPEVKYSDLLKKAAA